MMARIVCLPCSHFSLLLLISEVGYRLSQAAKTFDTSQSETSFICPTTWRGFFIVERPFPGTLLAYGHLHNKAPKYLTRSFN